MFGNIKQCTITDERKQESNLDIIGKISQDSKDINTLVIDQSELAKPQDISKFLRLLHEAMFCNNNVKNIILGNINIATENINDLAEIMNGSSGVFFGLSDDCNISEENFNILETHCLNSNLNKNAARVMEVIKEEQSEEEENLTVNLNDVELTDKPAKSIKEANSSKVGCGPNSKCIIS